MLGGAGAGLGARPLPPPPALLSEGTGSWGSRRHSSAPGAGRRRGGGADGGGADGGGAGGRGGAGPGQARAGARRVPRMPGALGRQARVRPGRGRFVLVCRAVPCRNLRKERAKKQSGGAEVCGASRA